MYCIQTGSILCGITFYFLVTRTSKPNLLHWFFTLFLLSKYSLLSAQNLTLITLTAKGGSYSRYKNSKQLQKAALQGTKQSHH